MSRSRHTSLGLFAACTTVLVGAGWDFPKPVRQDVSFNRDVLPILSDKCFTCHGPDSSSRQAGLRLDERSVATALRGNGRAIVPGRPEDSLLVRRIGDHDDPMPPVSSAKKLSEVEKRILRDWIAQGAPYSRLWSLEPLPAKVVPPVVDGDWPRDSLDRFVLDRLTKAGLRPSPPAAPERWLRRVTLDLTGLPPTEADIARFFKDKDYGGAVDRLLASPHFGERMASDWLDVARYGDSYGYQSDLLMPMWPYRDWVVKAFNDNKPYDQFLIEQIAGDLLPNASRDQILATAFNRLHRQSNEGGSIALEFKTEYAVDRVSTFGTAVLGLTLGCARCHDHKFDPISQKEFFQLYAYFNSIDEYGLLLSTEIVPTPSLLLPDPQQEGRLAVLRAKIENARADLEGARKSAALAFDSAKQVGPVGKATARFDFESEGPKFADVLGSYAVAEKLGGLASDAGRTGRGVLFDGETGLAVRGLAPSERWDSFTWSFWLKAPRVSAPTVLLHRTGGTDVGFCGLDLLFEDGRLTARVMRHWPGNAVAVQTVSRVPVGSWTHVAWSWDGSGTSQGLKLFIGGRPAQTTVLADSLWKKVRAYGDLGPSGGDWCFGQRFREAGLKGGSLDDVVFYDREASELEIALDATGALSQVSETQRAHAVESLDPAVQAAKQVIRGLQRELSLLEEEVKEISVMQESKTPVPAHVLARGQYDSPRTSQNRVARGVPSALPPLPRAISNDRLGLARWATAHDHPLTARVAVNRLWQLLFGTGLVETSENFGTQGTVPTHPELLDFLARRFVEEKWDVKRTLKRLVLSATYRQDSAPRDPKSRLKDPANRLLSRGPSSRLSAEMVRDVALLASGLLTDKVGGPPVNPYQPAGLWQENNTMSPELVQSKGPDLYRRSLYSTWKRTTPLPNMMLFDATSREACSVRRPVTSTPMQALVLLNDVQFVEAARVLAESVSKQHLGSEARLIAAFLRLAGRRPTARELVVLRSVVAEQTTQFRADPSLAENLVGVGESNADARLDKIELASLTVAVQTMMNSDAVIWKR